MKQIIKLVIKNISIKLHFDKNFMFYVNNEAFKYSKEIETSQKNLGCYFFV